MWSAFFVVVCCSISFQQIFHNTQTCTCKWHNMNTQINMLIKIRGITQFDVRTGYCNCECVGKTVCPDTWKVLAALHYYLNSHGKVCSSLEYTYFLNVSVLISHTSLPVLLMQILAKDNERVWDFYPHSSDYCHYSILGCEVL